MARFGRSRAFVRARGRLIGFVALSLCLLGLVAVELTWQPDDAAAVAQPVAAASTTPASATPAAATPAAVRTEYVAVPVVPAKGTACPAKKGRHGTATKTARCAVHGARKPRQAPASPH
jgi:hypothetical protein